MKSIRTSSTDKLFNAILNLKNLDECYDFFEDICTIKELQDLTQRLEVAKMLDEGKTYQQVSKETGASTATISRVSKCLLYGTGGYKKALERSAKE